MAYTPDDTPTVPSRSPEDPLPADPADARDANVRGTAASPSPRPPRPRWQLITAASVASVLLLGVGFAGGWGISAASGSATSVGERSDRPAGDGVGRLGERPHDDGERPYGDHDDDARGDGDGPAYDADDAAPTPTDRRDRGTP
ncbi:hypothetical protein ABXJ56_09875 [Microbacterium chocolatum]|uniref:hypothetical protein n=1 Tax=Microbacterium aurantiacum TaxID=162393 RepID=UPI00338DD744